MTLAIGAYFFCIAFILAQLEIQIEGPHGWAEKLPTWRWDSPRIRRWFGKPVTGHHLCLVTFMLLLLHLPQFHGGSWDREADLLAMFFLLTVIWDFLWFACNRHYGVARFRKGQIWWFPAWALGVPQPTSWRSHCLSVLPSRRPSGRERGRSAPGPGASSPASCSRSPPS
jgi:hypothetical protein